jgi:predicted adenine nucleotide alpha hydrolase (AANH) superfamily ATPase
MKIDLPEITLPIGEKLLLLSCCAPCSGDVIQTLAANKIDTTVLFYNPNIHFEEEYKKRLEENKNFALKYGFNFIDLDYDPDHWFEEIKGLENEPEKGRRCFKCFAMRLRRTAEYARAHGFTIFADTLGISRWKNLKQVHSAGEMIVKEFPELTYWPYNWRKQGGSMRMDQVARTQHFYRQNYCGCIYSRRD